MLLIVATHAPPNLQSISIEIKVLGEISEGPNRCTVKYADICEQKGINQSWPLIRSLEYIILYCETFGVVRRYGR